MAPTLLVQLQDEVSVTLRLYYKNLLCLKGGAIISLMV